MLPVAIGAASSLIDALKSLTSSSGMSTGIHPQPWASPFDNAGTTPVPLELPPSPAAGGVQIAPGTMNALFQAQGQSSVPIMPAVSPPDPLKDLFSQLDADGDGQISKAEFENALGAGGTNLAQADEVFSKLDQNSDGSVGLDEMTSALKTGRLHRDASSASASAASSYYSIEQLIQREALAIASSAAGSLSVSV